MARLAIFIDGGYVDKLAQNEFSVRVDFQRFADAILNAVLTRTPEPLDLLRVYYYHCLPYQSNPPTPEERRRFGEKQKFFSALNRLPRFIVREGRLVFRGYNRAGEPVFQQKRIDLQLGLDFALLAGKRQISHAAVVSGDSDLIPAFRVAKDEGIAVWLFHGPKVSRNRPGESTYAEEL